jgi:hypothetical protein
MTVSIARSERERWLHWGHNTTWGCPTGPSKRVLVDQKLRNPCHSCTCVCITRLCSTLTIGPRLYGITIMVRQPRWIIWHAQDTQTLEVLMKCTWRYYCMVLLPVCAVFYLCCDDTSCWYYCWQCLRRTSWSVHSAWLRHWHWDQVHATQQVSYHITLTYNIIMQSHHTTILCVHAVDLRQVRFYVCITCAKQV